MADLPLEIPIQSWPTPHVADRVLTEVWDTLRANQEPQQPGWPHPNLKDFPNFVFVGQVAIPGTEAFVHRVWVNDRAAEDTYNYNIEYSGEDPLCPIFDRDYLVRRASYAAPTMKTALTGVVGIKVTAGGSGYAIAPVVSFTGGAGSGATATAVIFRGAIVAIIITAEGSGYTSAPTVVLTPAVGDAGSGATATASIQPPTAILVSEKVIRAKDEPWDSLFVHVQRRWETLPGTLLTGQDWDRRLSVAKPYTKQIVVAGVGVGDALTTIEPINSVKQENRVETIPTAAILAYFRSSPANIEDLSSKLPDVLLGLVATFNTSTGDGSHNTEPAGASTGTSWALDLNDSSHSQGSAAIMPELTPTRRSFDSKFLRGTNNFFFIADNSLDSEIVTRLGQLLGRPVTSIVAGLVTTGPAPNGTVGHKLAINQIFQWSSVTGGSGTGVATGTNYYVKTVPTANTFTFSTTRGGSALTGSATSAVSIVPVNLMPTFYPALDTIKATGQHASVSADASAQQHVSESPGNTTFTYSTGSGTSKEIGLTNRSWDFPPMIHAAIVIKDAGNTPIVNPVTATAAATAGAGWGGGTNWPARGASASASKVVNAIFEPLTLAATTPTDWPTEGLYVTKLSTEEYDYGYSNVFVQLVDAYLFRAP